MSHRPSEHLKASADQLARLLAAAGDRQPILPRMRDLGLLGPASPPSPPPTADPDRLGVWLRQGDGGWRRDPDLDPAEAHMWSAAESIPPKGVRRRLVLLGESVARGFFFDPFYSPAGVLQQLLDEAAPEAWEVIDLARSEMGPEVVDLAAQALALEPEHLVVFGGNNWALFNPALWSSLPATTDPGALRAHVERALEALAEERVEKLAGLGVPATLVIPEFNLTDFTGEVRAGPPTLADPEALAAWAARWEAYEASEDGLEHALAMVELDGGASAFSLTLAARACDDPAKARRLLERARDAELWIRATTPRCPAALQQALRAEARRHDLGCVDLPAAFAEHLGDEAPGRSLFLDYCHLSVEGIGLAMRALATSLLGEAPGAARPPPPQVVARAHMLAAHHNASWGQGQELLRYHCEQARAADPDSEGQASTWVGIAGGRVPPLLTRAYQDAVAEGDTTALHRLATLGPFLYAELTTAMGEVFGLSEDLAARRARDHGLERGPVDLLETFGCASCWIQPEAAWNQQGAVYRAHTPRSRFFLVCEDSCPAEVRLVLRGPCAGEVELRVNGTPAGSLPLTPSWSTRTLGLPAEALGPGVNTLELRWPIGRTEGSFSVTEPYPVLGELARFVAEART